MKKVLLMMSIISLNHWANAQKRVGINENNPTETLHLKEGTIRVPELPEKGITGKNKIYTKSDGTASQTKDQDYSPTKLVVTDNNGVLGQLSQGTAGQMLVTLSNGVPSWQNVAIPNVPQPTAENPHLGTGTVIAIGGKLAIAEEITATMENVEIRQKVEGDGVYPIPHFKVLINNQNKFSSDAKSNRFSVTETGVYQIIMNVSIGNTSGMPVIGIWREDIKKWVARISRSFSGNLQTYTLITAIELKKDVEYSFRMANTHDFTIYGYNTGSTGLGPATFVSVKRLK